MRAGTTLAGRLVEALLNPPKERVLLYELIVANNIFKMDHLGNAKEAVVNIIQQYEAYYKDNAKNRMQGRAHKLMGEILE